AIGVLAGLPLLYYAGAGLIAIGATGMIYHNYVLGNTAILLARLKGWPKDPAPFRLGQWGLWVNILGLIWGVAMEINFLWPRNLAVGNQNPPVSSLPNLPNLGPIGSIPLFEATLAVILIVGFVYWAVAQRRALDTSVATAEARAYGGADAPGGVGEDIRSAPRAHLRRRGGAHVSAHVHRGRSRRGVPPHRRLHRPEPAHLCLDRRRAPARRRDLRRHPRHRHRRRERSRPRGGDESRRHSDRTRGQRGRHVRTRDRPDGRRHCAAGPVRARVPHHPAGRLAPRYADHARPFAARLLPP